jgi:hypothetical protein
VISARISFWPLFLGYWLGATACDSDEFTPPSPNASNDGSYSNDGNSSDSGTAQGDQSRPNVPGAADTKCNAYPIPSSAERIDSEIEFRAAAEDDLEGRVIVLEPGAYFVGGGMQIVADGTSIIGATDDPTDVVLFGSPNAGAAFTIRAANVTLANLTIEDPSGDAIRVMADGGSVDGLTLHQVRVENPVGTALSVTGSSDASADLGTVQCSTFLVEGTSDVHESPGCTTGAIRLEATVGWEISDNHFEGFWCATDLAQPVVQLKGQNQLTTIARNRFTHIASAIRIGDDAVPGDRRPLVPETAGDCGAGAFDDVRSTVVNNMVYSGRNIGTKGFESGIVVAHSCGTKIYHNTVYSKFSPNRNAAIEWLFESTTADVANNLTNHTISPGEGAASTFRNNIEDAADDLFRDVPTKDIRLAAGAFEAIGKGAVLGVDDDFDKTPRDDEPDIGANEYVPSS